MKSLQIGKFWWPTISKEIEETYKACDSCKEESISKMQKKATLVPDDLTLLAPGEEICLDFASMGTKKFLIIKDRMTGFLSVKQTKNQTAVFRFLENNPWIRGDRGYFTNF